MTYVDRLNGINSGLGFKAPVRVVATSNITLSGTQTIDSVAVVADDRVAATAQTTASENGIYNVSSGAWTRAKDFDGSRDVVGGTCFLVNEGTVNSGNIFRLSNTGTITIGTTSLTFTAKVSSITDAIHVIDYVPQGLRDAIGTGDNATDLATYIQTAADAAGTSGKALIFTGRGPWLHSVPILIRTTRDLDAVPGTGRPGEYQFADMVPFYIIGFGRPKIKATAAMDYQFLLADSSGRREPHYTRIENLHFDGNALAVAGVKYSYTRHCILINNTFDNMTRGFAYRGSAILWAAHNTFRCKYGVYNVPPSSAEGAGGDTYYLHNNFVTNANDSVGVYMEYFTGNVVFEGNTLTNEDNYTGSIGVQLNGATLNGTEAVRHVRITNNEFCGYNIAVRADGYSSGVKNVFAVKMTGNHVTNYGSVGDYPNAQNRQLLYAVDCQDFIVDGNFINYAIASDCPSVPIEMTRCTGFVIEGNQFTSLESTGISMTNCVRNMVIGNNFYNCGKLGTGYAIILFAGASSASNVVDGNLFYSSSASYGQIAINEDANVASTYGGGGVAIGVGTLFGKGAGSTSTVGQIYVATSAGAPADTPGTIAGYAPIRVDTTNHKLYFYSGGSWRDAGP